MSPGLQNQLLRDFPILYRGRFLPARENLMLFGFEVGDGWFDIIYGLSSELYLSDPLAMAMQVKEKFGGLRFYVDGLLTNRGDDAIIQAERLSFSTCEVCSNHGSLHNLHGWVRTLCVPCAENREKRGRYAT